MQRRTLLLVSAAAVATVGGALLVKPSAPPSPSPSGAALAFPGLAARLQSAARIEAKRHDGTLEVTRRGETWVLPAKGGYPVDIGKLRTLMLAIGGGEVVDQKTDDATRHARLGLEDTPPADDLHWRRLDISGARFKAGEVPSVPIHRLPPLCSSFCSASRSWKALKRSSSSWNS